MGLKIDLGIYLRDSYVAFLASPLFAPIATREREPLPTWPRLTRRSWAAAYCSFSAKSSVRVCPVQPIDLGGGLLRWDRHDIDEWIDSLKVGATRAETDEELFDRLD